MFPAWRVVGGGVVDVNPKDLCSHRLKMIQIHNLFDNILKLESDKPGSALKIPTR